MKHLIFVAGLALSVTYPAYSAEPAKKEPVKAEQKADANKAKKECKMVKDEKTGVEKEKCTYPKKAEKK